MTTYKNSCTHNKKSGSEFLNSYKKLSYRRGTARRTILVEILSTAAELYEK